MYLVYSPNYKAYLALLATVLGLMQASLPDNTINVANKRIKSPFDESVEKNDDSHLRLYYKSNSPSQSISHELEHRFVKSPNYRYESQQQGAGNFQSKLDFAAPPAPFAPLNNMQFVQPAAEQQNLFLDANGKNKQTLLNLHYHGNSFQGLGDMQQQMMNFQNIRNQQQQQQQQPNTARKNLLKMLLMNFSPATSNSMMYPQDQLFQQQPQQQQQSRMQFNPMQQFGDSFGNRQAKMDDGLQYKIVHLKFKIQPQLGS